MPEDFVHFTLSLTDEYAAFCYANTGFLLILRPKTKTPLRCAKVFFMVRCGGLEPSAY